jgi:two-component system, chemotaxis family, protein-glutamate methylesterase/glutaminase
VPESLHERIRVLVVDDSVAVRRLLTGILSSDPAIEVVGTACDGRAALAAIETLRPDVMTLDVEMPVLDGLSTLRELRKRWRSLPVIMLSTLTIRGAESTLDALTLGANDYVPKPTQMSDRGAAIEGVKTLLLPKVKALHAKYGGPTRAQAAGPSAAPAAAPPSTSQSIPGRSAVLPFPPLSRGSMAEIVAIGVSTGGPNALAVVLPGLPADLGVPIVIAQHIPPVFSGVLAQRLNSASKIRVVEAKGGEVPEAGFAYIAPGGQHLVVGGTRTAPKLALNDGPPENSCRPSVDVLFRSVAAVYGRALLGVMLTGMGQDGVEGSRNMRQAGGPVIVQDEATSVVWGMPGLVWKAGLAEGMFPLDEI